MGANLRKARSLRDGCLVAKERLSAEVLARVGDFAGRDISHTSFHVEWRVPDSEHWWVITAEKSAVFIQRPSATNKKVTGMEREVITQKVQINWTEVSNSNTGRLSVAESEEVPCLRQLSLPSPVDPCACRKQGINSATSLN